VKRLLLLGGGHAHALVLLKFQDFISKHLEVQLVTPSPVHVYSGMVPGVVAGHYAAAQAQIDLARLARSAAAELVIGRVLRLDPGAKQVELANGERLAYDVLSLNLGSVPQVAGAQAIAVKPFESFFARWRALLEKGPKAPRTAVIGAGAGGVELAMAMKFALAGRGEVVLFSEKNPFSPGMARRIRTALARLSVELREDRPVTTTEPGFDAMFWATGASALPLLRESGLRTDAGGYVLVDASLRSVSHPDVFAAGDNASLEGSAVPKSGVYAVRQGAVLAENLKRVVRGMPMLDYVPQKVSLSLISCGDKYAIASRGDWSAEGRWVWQWKNWIDRRWVAKFS
jgi:selenide,water dikinase